MVNYIVWKLTTFFKVLLFIDSHDTEITAVPEMADDVDDLRDAVAEIEAGEDVQETDIRGITENVTKAKEDMAETIIIYAHKAIPLARKADRLDLVKILKREETYILKASKATALARARVIKKTLETNTSIFTNIKPADITDMDDKIEVFNTIKESPSDAIDTRKDDGTKAIMTAYIKGNGALLNIYDFFYGHYQISQPALVKQLADLMKIEQEGVHHTGISCLFRDASLPVGDPASLIQGGLMKIVELNKQALSDINGGAGIIKIKPGTYHIEFSKTGFVTQTLVIKIKRGKILMMEVLMVRVSS